MKTATLKHFLNLYLQMHITTIHFFKVVELSQNSLIQRRVYQTYNKHFSTKQPTGKRRRVHADQQQANQEALFHNRPIKTGRKLHRQVARLQQCRVGRMDKITIRLQWLVFVDTLLVELFISF